MREHLSASFRVDLFWSYPFAPRERTNAVAEMHPPRVGTEPSRRDVMPDDRRARACESNPERAGGCPVDGD